MDPEVLEELRAVFVEEVAVQRAALADLRVTFERETSTPQDVHEAARDVFRIAHALKGAARAVGDEEIVALAHQVEETLLPIRSGQTIAADLASRELGRLLDGLNSSVAPPEPEPTSTTSDVPHQVRVPQAPAEIIAVSSKDVRDLLDGARELRAALFLAESEATTSSRDVLWQLEGVRRAIQRGDPRDDLLEELAVLDSLVRREVAGGPVDQVLLRERARTGARTLTDGLGRLHAQPVSDLVPQLELNALEVARIAGKRVRFAAHGGALRFDRSLLQRVFEALMHVVSNAVAHGIESPRERERAGKAPFGLVEVTSRHDGSAAVFTVRDDGRGMDEGALRRQAPDAALHPAFEPGVSTSSETSTVSGRGMGLDFVRRSVDELGGRVTVHSEPQKGTTVVVTTPLLEGGIAALLVCVEDTVYALPIEAIDRVLRVRSDDVSVEDGVLRCKVDGVNLRAARLEWVLRGEDASGSLPQRPLALLLVGDPDPCVLFVPLILQHADIVVRPLTGRLRSLPFLSCTFRQPAGSVGLLLDVDAIRSRIHAEQAQDACARGTEDSSHVVLVVDDSVTTRQLIRLVLEDAGYRVDVASHGREAWSMVREQGGYAAVVSDLEMPVMDGFELLERVRRSEGHSTMPFVVLTGRDEAKAREHCRRLGANAFVDKGTFENDELIQILEGILESS